MEYAKAIDEHITLYLRNNLITQNELAKKLALSKNAMNNKRRGRTEWKLNELVALGEVLDMPAAELLKPI